MKSGKLKMEEEEEEHKVYGGVVGETVAPDPDIDDDEAAAKKLEEVKRILKETEIEADALREMQAKFENDMRAIQDSASVES